MLVNDFKDRFPGEFSDTIVDQWIPVLEPVYPVYFGGDYTIARDKEIILNLLGHLMFMETTGTNNSIRSLSSGSVRGVSYSNDANSGTGNNNDFFKTTKYGQRYLLLTGYRRGAKSV